MISNSIRSTTSLRSVRNCLNERMKPRKMAQKLRSNKLALLQMMRVAFADAALFFTVSLLHMSICAFPLCSADILVPTSELTGAMSQCSVENFQGVSLLQLSQSNSVMPQNSTCYLTIRGQYAPTRQRYQPLQWFTLLTIADREQVESQRYCGFCPALQSNYSQVPDRTSATITNSSTGLTVGHCVNQRSTNTSFDPLQRGAAVSTTKLISSSWQGAMAWSLANLSVVVDGSCTSHNLYVIQSSSQAWSICWPTANGVLSNIGASIRQLVLFAQDRVLSSWVSLPFEFTCSEWKDYEWILAKQNFFSGNITLTITLYMIPMSNSCQMLCIADKCAFDLKSTNQIDYVVNDSLSLTVRYIVRTDARHCDSNAYSGFVLLINWSYPWAFEISTYELDSPFRYADVHNVTEGTESPTQLPLLISASAVGAIAAGCVVAVVALVTTAVFVARWRARHTKQQSQAVELTITDIDLSTKIGNPSMLKKEVSLSIDCDRAVACAGKCSLTATTVTTKACISSAGSLGSTPPGGRTSQQYGEIVADGPSSSEPQRRHCRNDNFVANFVAKHTSSHAAPMTNLSPPEYITLCSSEEPEVRYVSLEPSADTSLYCDLITSADWHATHNDRLPKINS